MGGGGSTDRPQIVSPSRISSMEYNREGNFGHEDSKVWNCRGVLWCCDYEEFGNDGG